MIEFFFDFSSPYSYLSSTRIDEIAMRRNVAVAWNAILLGPIFKALGKMPLAARPREGDHARIDLDRWARRMGVPLRFPPRFPFNSLAAARGALVAADQGRAGPYCRRVFQAAWGEGLDVEDPAVLGMAASEAGLDPAVLRASIQEQEIKDRLRALTDQALARGVFGAPTFFVGDEMFHGNDRLFMVEEAVSDRQALETGRPTTPFNRWFGMRCSSRGEGAAEYELVITESLVNRRGVAHGGAVTSLLDTALGAAVVSGIAPEEWCATLELSVQFREPVRQGRIMGRGRLVKRGRHAAFAQGEVVDGDGRVLAAAHGTWYIWPRRPD